MEARAEHLPVKIEFIDTAERVDQLLPTLYDMVTDGLIEEQDTTIVKAVSSDKPAPETPYTKHREQKAARLMRIFLGEADQFDGEPLYEAIVKRLRMLEISGATVDRGILGYGAKGHTHKESFLHLSRDLPIVISVIDSAEKLRSGGASRDREDDVGRFDRDVRCGSGPGRSWLSCSKCIARRRIALRASRSTRRSWTAAASSRSPARPCCAGWKDTGKRRLFIAEPVTILIVDSAEQIQALAPAIEQMLERGMMSISEVSARRIQR